MKRISYSIVAALMAAGIAQAEVATYGGVYAGGYLSKDPATGEKLPGLSNLAIPANSDSYRALGGGLYVHGMGWSSTSDEDKVTISELFPNAPMFETAYNTNSAFNGAGQTLIVLRDRMRPYWNKAFCIAVNNLGRRTAEEMQQFVDHVSEYTYLVAPIAAPNTAGDGDIPRWDIPWSDPYWDDVRTIALIGGALSFDSPPNFYLGRPDNYKQWIADQSRWAYENGVYMIGMANPRYSTDFFADFEAYRQDIYARGGIVHSWAFNCFNSTNSYIGSEEIPNDMMYTALKTAEREALDRDMDGIPDVSDNAVMWPNPDQEDQNMNGVGDVAEVAVPARIDAEHFINNSSFVVQNCIEGARMITQSANGHTADYAVIVPETGTYPIDFRVSSSSSNIQFRVKNGPDILATINTTTTGNMNTFKTVSSSVFLEEGLQIITIEAVSSEWNMNWFEISIIDVRLIGVAPDGMVSVGLQSQPGRSYILQFRDSLLSGSGWQNVTELAAGDGEEIVLEHEGGTPSGFYRVISTLDSGGAAIITATTAGPINDSATWGGATLPTAGDTDTWDMAGYRITHGTETFHGGLLSVKSGAILAPAAGAILVLQATTFDNGEIRKLTNVASAYDFSGKTLTFASGGAAFLSDAQNRNIALKNAVWAGSGGISFTKSGTSTGASVLTLNADNTLSGYRGTISMFNTGAGTARLTIEAATTGSFGVNIGTGSFLDVRDESKTYTFSSLVLGGETIAAGTYAYTDFSTAQKTYLFTDGTPGMVTVIPEPATLGMVALSTFLILVGRRIRM